MWTFKRIIYKVKGLFEQWLPHAQHRRRDDGEGATQRRAKYCSKGEHRYTKPSTWTSVLPREASRIEDRQIGPQPGPRMSGCHCRDCGHWQVWPAPTLVGDAVLRGDSA